MPKVLFLKGLPASGKSTYAKDLVASAPDEWVRVNKDDIRLMLHDRKWIRGREKTVENTQLSIALAALQRGQSVVVDNTHMSPRHEAIWREVAKNNGAEFEMKEFDTTIEDCLKRDQERGIPAGAVGKDVILRMFYQHGCEQRPDESKLPPAYIFDIDGTLATMKDRSPFEWEKVGNDEINNRVLRVLNSCRENGYHIILLSGRDSVCRTHTENWLNENSVKYDDLFMRAEGNIEPDTIIKRRLFNDHIDGKYEVVGVFDDRPCVVRMWRKMGLFCFDCGNGIEF